MSEPVSNVTSGAAASANQPKPDSIQAKLAALENKNTAVNKEGEQQDPGVKAPSPAEDPDMASRFAALSRKEKKLMEDRRQLEADRAEIERFRQLKGKAKDDPDAWLAEAGLTLDEALDRKLRGLSTEDPESDRVKTLEQKIQELLDKDRRKEEEYQQARLNEAREGFLDRIRQTVEGAKSDFELISAFDAFDDVFETCARYWEETKDPETGEGKTLDIEKACRLVEAELEERVSKYKGVGKLKAMFEAMKESGSQTDTKPQATDMTPSTLTNRVVSPAQPEQKTGLLPREESIARAADFLKQELAKRSGR